MLTETVEVPVTSFFQVQCDIFENDFGDSLSPRFCSFSTCRNVLPLETEEPFHGTSVICSGRQCFPYLFCRIEQSHLEEFRSRGLPSCRANPDTCLTGLV